MEGEEVQDLQDNNIHKKKAKKTSADWKTDMLVWMTVKSIFCFG